MRREICEFCGTDEQEIVLTPIHITIPGIQKTYFFHNTIEHRCLEAWLRDQRALLHATQN
ncbi:MAG TPA: hypothetical protein VGI45_24900 [Terracidiphilus sp.]